MKPQVDHAGKSNKLGIFHFILAINPLWDPKGYHQCSKYWIQASFVGARGNVTSIGDELKASQDDLAWITHKMYVDLWGNSSTKWALFWSNLSNISGKTSRLVDYKKYCTATEPISNIWQKRDHVCTLTYVKPIFFASSSMCVYNGRISDRNLCKLVAECCSCPSTQQWLLC